MNDNIKLEKREIDIILAWASVIDGRFGLQQEEVRLKNKIQKIADEHTKEEILKLRWNR